ncbi:hypothetical protein NPIL_299301, partial [Nephila pilipes]
MTNGVAKERISFKVTVFESFNIAGFCCKTMSNLSGSKESEEKLWRNFVKFGPASQQVFEVIAEQLSIPTTSEETLDAVERILQMARLEQQDRVEILQSRQRDQVSAVLRLEPTRRLQHDQADAARRLQHDQA